MQHQNECVCVSVHLDKMIFWEHVLVCVCVCVVYPKQYEYKNKTSKLNELIMTKTTEKENGYDEKTTRYRHVRMEHLMLPLLFYQIHVTHQLIWPTYLWKQIFPEALFNDTYMHNILVAFGLNGESRKYWQCVSVCVWEEFIPAIYTGTHIYQKKKKKKKCGRRGIK